MCSAIVGGDDAAYNGGPHHVQARQDTSLGLRLKTGILPYSDL
jgi:hypothetical protein